MEKKVSGVCNLELVTVKLKNLTSLSISKNFITIGATHFHQLSISPTASLTLKRHNLPYSDLSAT
jgi:hypothetical protein